MELFPILRFLHILAGFLGFVVAPVVLASKKGGRVHRIWGKVFFWSMALVALTAVVMAPMKNNIFLTCVAVFSFYLGFTGYRALYRKDAFKTRKAEFIDWFFAILNSVFSLSLLILGILNLPGSFGIVAIVFGIIGSWLGTQHIISFIRPSPDKHHWFFSHMTGMITSYIASLSAFSAVNLTFDWFPPVLQWLWPTLIGTPLLIIWIRSYEKKFKKGRKIKEEVIVKIKVDSVE